MTTAVISPSRIFTNFPKHNLCPREKRSALRERLGHDLNALRCASGFHTIRKFRKATGVSMQTIIQLEKGMHTRDHVTIAILHRLAKTLGRELVIRINGIEIHCGATTVLEDLIGKGAEVGFSAEE